MNKQPNKGGRKKSASSTRSVKIPVVWTPEEAEILDRATTQVQEAYAKRNSGERFTRSDLIRRGALAEAYRQLEAKEGYEPMICGLIHLDYPQPEPKPVESSGPRCASCGTRTHRTVGFYCEDCHQRRRDVALIMERPETRPLTSYELDDIVSRDSRRRSEGA